MSARIAGVAAAVAPIREWSRIESTLLLNFPFTPDSMSLCVRPERQSSGSTGTPSRLRPHLLTSLLANGRKPAAPSPFFPAAPPPAHDIPPLTHQCLLTPPVPH